MKLTPRSLQQAPPNALTVITHPGIGDFAWCYAKLVSLNRPLIVRYRTTRESHRLPVSSRVTQLLDLLPQVAAYSPIQIAESAIDQKAMPTARQLARTKQTYFALNRHLEHGKQLDQYVPELQTQYHFPMKLTEQHRREALKALDGRQHPLVVYPSAKGNVANWRGWNTADWADFAARFRCHYGNVPVVVIGATWDKDLSAEVAAAIPDSLDLTGQTQLGVTLELLRQASYFVSFPSGLGVLAQVIRTRVYMFYPPHLELMIPTWADPNDIASGHYVGSLWKPPEEVMATVTEVLPAF